MEEYVKIQSVFKRDEKTHKFIEGQYSLPEFEYLKDNLWLFTEKIDGTNVRVEWDAELDTLAFGGRTDNAQMPPFLLDKLRELFPWQKFRTLYPNESMLLFGEGYGARIQKGGGNYIPNGVNFALFDVKIDGLYLERHNVQDIADKLGVKPVPYFGVGTLLEAIKWVKEGVRSALSSCNAEGFVLRPRVELQTRRGFRVITKLKTKDF